MSRSLLNLIKAYGDAREWQGAQGGGAYRADEMLADVEARMEAIEDAAIQIGVDGETISALLDGDA